MPNEPPKTADGEPIVEGMDVWLYSRLHPGIVCRTVGWVSREGRVYTTQGTYSVNPLTLYASRGRAEAALKQQ